MFSGMGRSLGGELACLVVTGLNAAQQSVTTTLKAWLPSYHSGSCLRKDTFCYDLSGSKRVHGKTMNYKSTNFDKLICQYTAYLGRNQ